MIIHSIFIILLSLPFLIKYVHSFIINIFSHLNDNISFQF